VGAALDGLLDVGLVVFTVGEAVLDEGALVLTVGAKVLPVGDEVPVGLVVGAVLVGAVVVVVGAVVGARVGAVMGAVVVVLGAFVGSRVLGALVGDAVTLKVVSKSIAWLSVKEQLSNRRPAFVAASAPPFMRALLLSKTLRLIVMPSVFSV
jgi:hypothetical protein